MRNSNHTYSLILATYKEVPNLKSLLPTLCALMEKRHTVYEILIVDDNSKDGTDKLISLLQSKKKPIRLHTRTKAKGLATALVEGTKLARYDNVIRMDADWSHRPDDLEKMLDVYESQKKPSMVIGSRFTKGSVYVGKPISNQLTSFLGRTVSRVLFKLPYKDLSNDFRIFPRSAWNAISNNLTIVGNTFLIQEIVLLKKNGLPILEVPTTFKERELGFSKLNVIKEIERYFKALPILIWNAYGPSK